MSPAAALKKASIPTLLACLAHATGDRRWITAPYLPKRDVSLFPDAGGGLTEAHQAEVRAAARGAAREPEERSHHAGGAARRCLHARHHEHLSRGARRAGIRADDPRGDGARGPQRPPLAARRCRGSGAGCADHRRRHLRPLRGRAARRDGRALPHRGEERRPGRHLAGQRLPEARRRRTTSTPTPSSPTSTGSSNYSKRAEVLDYLRGMANRRGLRRHIRFGTEVLALDWREAKQKWQVRSRHADGSETDEWASIVITAVGQLNRPKMAPFPGMDTFTGRWWHSARWPDDADLAGKHVAVIGTGASAMQFLRTVAAQAKKVTVFQRSPQWARPDPDYHGKVSDEARWLLRHMPYYHAWYRFGLIWRFGDGLLRTLKRDPEWPHPERSMNRRNDRHREALTQHLLGELQGRDDLIAKCLPKYPPYGKRILVDNGWYEALRRDNVELVTDGVAKVDGNQVVTTAGQRVEPDVIVLATGFEAGKMLAPMHIVGRSGVSLRDRWGDDDPKAYLGTTVADYPNLFVLSGPNTGLAHGGSVMFMSECQTRYICGCIKTMLEQGIHALEVRTEVQDDYCRRVDAEHAELVWTHPGMRNWYRNDQGRVFSPVPWRLVDFWQMTHEPELADYVAT